MRTATDELFLFLNPHLEDLNHKLVRRQYRNIIWLLIALVLSGYVTTRFVGLSFDKQQLFPSLVPRHPEILGYAGIYALLFVLVVGWTVWFTWKSHVLNSPDMVEIREWRHDKKTLQFSQFSQAYFKAAYHRYLSLRDQPRRFLVTVEWQRFVDHYTTVVKSSSTC